MRSHVQRESGAAVLEVCLPDPQSFVLQSGAKPIGRGSDNSIQVDDPSVSGHHCEIILGSDGAVIRDLGSTNGTFVSGRRVQMAALNYDEPFRLADVECVLRQLESSPLPVITVAKPKSKRVKISREAWEALVLGSGMAVLIWLVPLLRHVIEFLQVIIHEGGHTVTAWLLGRPSIPMLRPGGGVAAHIERPTWMLVLLLAAVIYVLYQAYRCRWHRVVVSIGAGVYLLCLLPDVSRFLITSMGHGAEVMVASLFLYRALSGPLDYCSCRAPALRRSSFGDLCFGPAVRV